MPTVRSICHGGIWRSVTRALIDRTHGRASAKVISDIGAIESGLWHASHLSWKIGAMSFVNVGGVLAASAAAAAPGKTRAPVSTHAPNATVRALLDVDSVIFVLQLDSTARSLSRKCWSNSIENRSRLRPIRRWPGHAAGIRLVPRK